MGSVNESPRRFYTEPADVPVVDYQALKGTGEAHEDALAQLDRAFQTYGFAYISNHSIPQKIVDEAFARSARFFKLPAQVKAIIAHPASNDPHRGWVHDGLSHVSQMVFDREEVQQLRKTSPERKETLETGSPHSKQVPENKWLPEDEFPGQKAFFESWWDACTELNHSLLQSLCESLQLEQDYLSKNQTKNCCHMSWQYYPSMPLKPLQNSDFKRLNAHTDFGQLTLLFQDMVGGLEIHDGKEFRPVVPKPDTVVINVGDMLERQTNGRWKSALHRVVAPSQFMIPKEDEVDAVIDRYSIAYFGTPDPDSVVGTLPGCEVEGRWKPNMIGNWTDNMTASTWIEKRIAMEY